MQLVDQCDEIGDEEHGPTGRWRPRNERIPYPEEERKCVSEDLRGITPFRTLLAATFKDEAIAMTPKKGQSWKSAYDEFLDSATKRQKDIIEGIHGAAQAAREAEGVEAIKEAEASAHLEQDMDDLDELQQDRMQSGGLQMSQEGLSMLKQQLTPIAEEN
ncbi:hypothetical protein VNI00_012958 [Paramarasmius palmivorus]|uniref:Uncharacterized protein n=1 Tax=Paramarasmius palmivorus TaxID=297713 RepID=A0AAW0BYR0_9AGAR